MPTPNTPRDATSRPIMPPSVHPLPAPIDDAARAQTESVKQLLEAARAQREALDLQGELAMRTADAITALGAGNEAISDALQASARLAADRQQETATLTAIAREQRDAIRLVAWSMVLTALTAVSALSAVAFHFFH